MQKTYLLESNPTINVQNKINNLWNAINNNFNWIVIYTNIFWLYNGLITQFQKLVKKMQNLYNEQTFKITMNKINELNVALKQINPNNTNFYGFNEAYINQGLLLAKDEAAYITNFSMNSQEKNTAKALLNNIESKYNWILKYQGWDWDASLIYNTFKVLIQQMNNLYNSSLINN